MLEKTLQQIAATKGVIDIIALGSGAYLGYCVSQGIELHAATKFSLIGTPIAIQTSFGGVLGLIDGISEHEESYSKPIIKRGVTGLSLGALETFVGYCIGNTIGSMIR